MMRKINTNIIRIWNNVLFSLVYLSDSSSSFLDALYPGFVAVLLPPCRLQCCSIWKLLANTVVFRSVSVVFP